MILNPDFTRVLCWNGNKPGNLWVQVVFHFFCCSLGVNGKWRWEGRLNIPWRGWGLERQSTYRELHACPQLDIEVSCPVFPCSHSPTCLHQGASVKIQFFWNNVVGIFTLSFCSRLSLLPDQQEEITQRIIGACVGEQITPCILLIPSGLKKNGIYGLICSHSD